MPSRVLGVIAARGGSKGIARKNVATVLGRPLIYYTIAAARESRNLSRTVLSTEDEEIANTGRQLGADVPWLRPAHLVGDDVASVDVVLHALETAEAEEERKYDCVVLLQPTAPLRTGQDIDAAIGLLENGGADAVVSVAQIEEPHPFKLMSIEAGIVVPLFPERWHERLRRQELEPAYYLNGAVYVVRRDVLLEQKSLWGKRAVPYVMPRERSVNIDNSLDLKLAEVMLREGRRGQNATR